MKTEPGPSTALVADDDEFFRIALRTILKSELGFADVIETGSLEEAVEQLAVHDEIALALFDLAMPGMKDAGSLEAVRDFRRDMRIAVVSASTRKSDMLTALSAGVHGYVPKGLGAAELAAALGRVLDGAIYVPPEIAARDKGDEPREEPEPSKGPESRVIDSLTPRQRDVLVLLVDGLSNKEIARKLQLGEGTVKIHLAALLRSLGVRNRQAAAATGARLLSNRQGETR
ncbi:response regulator transcription factor [Chelativorans sp. M5D2P16]|uniref:response regulator transcription factor n=1 Tax=Chelativorans sp. M5D2P16 TaxID=3095678 RepID=UPI002ACA0041|nr:response regulator transcription factor [Chelativorans sp. M5D2P16]MDZ5696191.1 response regulator transcription factor [Chelativorans sp. M5D2P16]